MDVLHFPLQGYKSFEIDEENDVVYSLMAVSDGMFYIRRSHYAEVEDKGGLKSIDRKFFDSIISYDMKWLLGVTTMYRNDSEIYEIEICFNGMETICLYFQGEETADIWYRKIFKLLYPDRIAALKEFRQ